MAATGAVGEQREGYNGVPAQVAQHDQPKELASLRGNLFEVYCILFSLKPLPRNRIPFH